MIISIKVFKFLFENVITIIYFLGEFDSYDFRIPDFTNFPLPLKINELLPYFYNN